MKKKVALECTLRGLGGLGGLGFWTFTVREPGVPWAEIMARWARFRAWVAWEGRRFTGLRVAEAHPGGHGWHLHLVVVGRPRVEWVRELAMRSGFGRIHVERVRNPEGLGSYLAKYLGKQLRSEYGERVRRFARFGCGRSCPEWYCRVVDVVVGGGYVEWVRVRKSGLRWRDWVWAEVCWVMGWEFISAADVMRRLYDFVRDWKTGVREELPGNAACLGGCVSGA